MTSAKSKPYHHGHLRETVLQLALSALENGAPEDLSLRALARQAEVSPRAIYRHFADREALLSAVAHEGFSDLGARMMVGDKASDPKEALVALGVVYVGFAVERPGLFRLMYGGKPPATAIAPGEAPHAAYAALARRIGELARPGEEAAAFLASWSLVHGLATLLVTERIRQPLADPVAVAEQICRILVRAFAVR